MFEKEKVLNNRRLFFGSIPMTKTRDEVWKALTRQGVQNIVDVIAYKSYSKRYVNRGYAFVEFTTVSEAAKARAKYKGSLTLFGKKVIIDWSNPLIEPEPEDMKHVKKLFVRNIAVTMTRYEFVEILSNILLDMTSIQKVYKFKDYSFIHFHTRKSAEIALETLKLHLTGSYEVMWAKPPERDFTSPVFTNDENYSFTDGEDTASSSILLDYNKRSPQLFDGRNSSLSSLPVDVYSNSSFESSSTVSSSGFCSTDQIDSSLTESVIDDTSPKLCAESYPLLHNEPEWILDFMKHSLKVELENKTVKDLLEELNINFFNEM